MTLQSRMLTRRKTHVARGRTSYGKQDAGAPAEGEQVEGAQLARLIELAVLGFGEVLLPVDFLQGR